MVTTLDDVLRHPERSPRNHWRRETPGTAGWTRTARPGDPHKYFVVSADCHAVEPGDFLAGIEPSFRARIPRLELRDDGSEWLISEGNRPQRVRGAKVDAGRAAEGRAQRAAGERSATGVGGRMDDEDVLRNSTGRTVAERLARAGRRRRRRGADVPDQGTPVLGEPRPGLRAGDVPPVESLGARLLR